MLPVQAPDESLHEKGLLHYWAMQFLHDEHGNLAGYAGFQSQGVFKNEPLHRRVVNFAIWDSDASNTDSRMVDTENPECRCHQNMLPYEWEDQGHPIDSLSIPDRPAKRTSIGGGAYG